MPVALAGLADFAAAALASLEAVAAFLLAIAAIYMWLGLVRPIFRGVSHILPGGWSLFGKTIVPNLRQDWLNLEAAMYQGLLDWRRGSEIEIAFTWHWMAQAWRWNAGMVEWLANETAQTIDWAVHVRMPKWAKYALLAPLWPILLPKVLRYVMAHVHTVVVKPIRIVERQLPGKVVRIVKMAGAATIPGIWAIPGFMDAWHGLTKRLARIHWRLSRLEKLLTVAGMAAAVAAVMGVRPSCLKRNGNIGRAARQLCGLDSGLLSALLTGLVVLAGPISLEEFGRELVEIESELANLVVRGFIELDGFTA